MASKEAIDWVSEHIINLEQMSVNHANETSFDNGKHSVIKVLRTFTKKLVDEGNDVIALDLVKTLYSKDLTKYTTIEDFLGDE